MAGWQSLGVSASRNCVRRFRGNVLSCRWSRVTRFSTRGWIRIYPGLVLELSSLDLEEIANALADQTDCEHR
jgi:hypothetical protein